MPIDDVIAETTDVGALQEQIEHERLRSEMAAPRDPAPRTSLQGVVQFEKSDIHLWVDVAILVVLLLIMLRQ